MENAESKKTKKWIMEMSGVCGIWARRKETI